VKSAHALEAAAPITIGQFYAVHPRATCRPPRAFHWQACASSNRIFFESGENIAMTDVDSALLAIETIVEQARARRNHPPTFRAMSLTIIVFNSFRKA
jgi:hypothetical protein